MRMSRQENSHIQTQERTRTRAHVHTHTHAQPQRSILINVIALPHIHIERPPKTFTHTHTLGNTGALRRKQTLLSTQRSAPAPALSRVTGNLGLSPPQRNFLKTQPDAHPPARLHSLESNFLSSEPASFLVGMPPAGIIRSLTPRRLFFRVPTHPPTRAPSLLPSSLGLFTSRRKMKPKPQVPLRGSTPLPKLEEKRDSGRLPIDVISGEGSRALSSQPKL